MKLLDLAQKLQKIYVEHGDVEILLDYEGGPYSLKEVEFMISKGQYPKSWNMPKGIKFVCLNY